MLYRALAEDFEQFLAVCIVFTIPKRLRIYFRFDRRSAERDAKLAASLWLRGRTRPAAERAEACADFGRALELATALAPSALAAEELSLEALERARAGC